MSTFAGFPPDAWAFLAGLDASSSKAFFDANRHRYDDGIAGPSKALVATLADLLPDRLDLDVRAEPKLGRSLFRINRDTRFAADRTPYKTHVDFLFWVGDGPPRPFPAEHPSDDLLCRDGFHLSRTTPHPAPIAEPAFTAWCADALTPFVPVVA